MDTSKNRNGNDDIELKNTELPEASDTLPSNNVSLNPSGKVRTDQIDPLFRGMLQEIVDEEENVVPEENSADPESPTNDNNEDTTGSDEFIIRNDAGEEKDDPEDSVDSKHSLINEWKRWNPLVTSFAVLLLVGVVIGIVVISKTRKHSPPSSTIPSSTIVTTKSPSIQSTFSSAPSLLASQVPNNNVSLSPVIASPPTRIPTLSRPSQPADNPSGVPTQKPTLSPTAGQTLAPTKLPTQSPTQTPTTAVIPINDVCTSAIGPLLSDFSSNFGTIVNAGVDTFDRCGDVKDSGPGVWYYTIGTGGEMMAHTCLDTTFNSKIAIFGGTCEKPVCIEANDDYCGADTSLSAVSWNSMYGELYYVLVTGNSDFKDGSFNLVIGARSNDECSTAIGPLAVKDSTPVLGTTIGATPNDVFCDGVANESNSVWYLVRGTGGEMRVNWCEETNFSARITILTGSCDELKCTILTSSDKCSVTWNSIVSRNYYVLVAGQKAKEIGDFSLRFSTTEHFSNDKCEDAIGPLALDGIRIEGSTAMATADTDAPFCYTATTANGLWYFVEGTGSIIQASLCDSLSYDTRLSIYRGDCSAGDGLSSLFCVDGNDDFCGEQSLVTWDSEKGVTYYILVHGYLDNSGEFSLTVTGL